MQHQIKTIDANILVDYFLSDKLDRDRRSSITKFFQPSNTGDTKIRIFVYTLGEVFKRVLGTRDGITVNLFDYRRQESLEKLQGWISSNFISIVRLDDISSDFFDHYKCIDKSDSLIQKGDKIALAAFCADMESKAFYSIDTHIIGSIKVQSYIHSIDKSKTIREP